MRDERTYHQLSLDETLCKTFRIFFGRLDVFMPLALGVTFPMALTTILFVASLVANVHSNDDVWDYFVNHLGTCLSYLVFQSMLYVILYFAVEGAMVRAAAEIYAGKSPQWYSCFCQGLNKFGSLLCARLLVWFFYVSTTLLVLGLCTALLDSSSSSQQQQQQQPPNWAFSLVSLLVIAYLGVAFTVWMTTLILYPVIMIERRPTRAAIRRSFALSRGMRCYFFCTALCLWLVKIVLLGLLQGMLVNNTSTLSSLVSIAGVIATALASLFSLPLTTVLSTVMYMSARARLEESSFSRYDLLADLRIEPDEHDNNDDDDNNNNNRDEHTVPLLSDTDAEVEEAPPIAENIIVVHDKEQMPANVPEASEVV